MLWRAETCIDDDNWREMLDLEGEQIILLFKSILKWIPKKKIYKDQLRDLRDHLTPKLFML